MADVVSDYKLHHKPLQTFVPHSHLINRPTRSENKYRPRSEITLEPKPQRQRSRRPCDKKIRWLLLTLLILLFTFAGLTSIIFPSYAQCFYSHSLWIRYTRMLFSSFKGLKNARIGQSLVLEFSRMGNLHAGLINFIDHLYSMFKAACICQPQPFSASLASRIPVVPFGKKYRQWPTVPPCWR